jgi:hypothetical protein
VYGDSKAHSPQSAASDSHPAVTVLHRYSRTDIESDLTLLAQLEAWHKWTHATFKSFAQNSTELDSWQVVVPKLALTYDYLRYNILAMSYLHLADELPQTSSPSRQLLLSLEYQRRAYLAFQQRPEVSLTGPEFDSIYAFTNLTIALVISMPSYLRHTRLERGGVMENMQTLFGLLRGTHALVTSNPTMIQDSVFSVTMDFLMLPPPELTDESTKHALTRLKLITHNEATAGLGSCAQSSYADGIEWLQTCFAYFNTGMYIYFMVWPLNLDAALLQALGSSDSVALLLLLHWAVLLHRLSGHKWWAKDAGKLLVCEVTHLLSRKEEVWLESIHWVHQQVGLPYYAKTYPRILPETLKQSGHLI